VGLVDYFLVQQANKGAIMDCGARMGMGGEIYCAGIIEIMGISGDACNASLRFVQAINILANSCTKRTPTMANE